MTVDQFKETMYSQMSCVVSGAKPSQLRHRLTINTIYETTAYHTLSHLDVCQIHEHSNSAIGSFILSCHPVVSRKSSEILRLPKNTWVHISFEDIRFLKWLVCQKSAKQSFLCDVEAIFEPLSATMCILIHRAGIECHQEHLRIYKNRRYALPKQYNSHSWMISGMGYSPHI